MNKIELVSKSVFLGFLGYLTFLMISNGGFSFLHNIDLIFHEAGHFLLIPFGEFVHFLGGTIGQLAIPIIFGVYFLYQKNYYATVVMLWWLGENIFDVSIYASDARLQALPLIGGEHDWTYILSNTGLLQQDILIGKTLFFLGMAIMITSVVLGFFAIYFNYRKGLIK